MEARFGLVHAFSSDFTGKFKISHTGYLDAVLKLKLNEKVTAGFTTGLNIASIPSARANSLPVGLSFDLKL